MSDEGLLRRRFPRYLADLEIIVYQARKVVRGRIKQISRGGCRFILRFPPSRRLT